MITYKEFSSAVKKLTPSQTRRLHNLIRENPQGVSQEDLDAFVSSCQAEETSRTSISRRIQNSQLSAALSWMDSNFLRSTHGKH